MYPVIPKYISNIPSIMGKVSLEITTNFSSAVNNPKESIR